MNSSVYIALLMVAVISLLAIGITWLNRTKKEKEKKKLLAEFDDFVVRNQLTIDKKQTLHRNMIGLDRLNLKIVFLDNNHVPGIFHVISLEELSGCHLIKQQNPSSGHTSKIFLKCSFKQDGIQDVNLPFYDEMNDDLYKMMRLSKKASYWKKSITIFRESALLSTQGV